MSGYATAEILAEALDVEHLDRDLYRGVHAKGSELRPSLYGGQVAAQALRAAGLTVAPDRFPHSLHGYFLRAGRVEHPVILKVDRDRDGGSFSSRHVTAVQDGEVIFSMIASFHRDEVGDVLDAIPHRERTMPEGDTTRMWDPLLEIRELTPSRFEGDRFYLTDHLMVRSAGPLPDDRLTHACAITYFSDLSTGFGQLAEPLQSHGGPSIDHALWFHKSVRGDQWVTLEMWPGKAGGQRGLYFGAIRDDTGDLVAVIAQEMLLRPPGPPPAPSNSSSG